MRLLILLTVAAALLPVDAADAAQKRTCGSRHPYSVAHSRYGRIYAHDYDGGDRTAYRGCLYRHKGSVKIADVDNTVDGHFSEWVDTFTMAGRYVAFVKQECGLGDCENFQVRVWDLRRRIRTHGGGQVGRGFVTRLVLTFSGQAGVLGGYDGEHFIDAYDSAGITNLDRGPNVGAGFALDGRTLRWMHDSEPRSYELR